MEDRRASQRLTLRLPAIYRIIGAKLPALATVVNIGPTGVCFITASRIDGNPEIELTIELETDNSVCLNTRLVWSEDTNNSGEFQNGVKIINGDSEDKEEFIDFCNRKLSNPPESLS